MSYTPQLDVELKVALDYLLAMKLTVLLYCKTCHAFDCL